MTGQAVPRAPGPGKRTLSEALGATAPAPVQRVASGAGPGISAAPPAPSRASGTSGDEAVHAAAARGTTTSASGLPFADSIQRAFGRHDISSVQAHVGGEAAASARSMGAAAYASGNHVVFGGAPDLHTAAHEAAHVVQQRAGVHLKGGVGQEGDSYERHADAVADAVVQGRSAEALLDRQTGSGGGGSAVQAKLYEPAPVPESPASPGASAPAPQPAALPKPPVPRLEVLTSQAKKIVDGFRTSSHYLALQRQSDMKPDDIDAALEVLRTGDKYNVEVVRHATGELDAHRTHGTMERVLWQAVTDMTRGQQIFGCDIHDKAKLSAEEKIAIFSKAIAAGYRTFDAAEAYGTTPFLLTAASRAGVAPSALTLLYKSRPVELGDAAKTGAMSPHLAGDEKQKKAFADRLKADMTTIPGAAKKVLMLHDLDASMEVNKRCIEAMYEQVGEPGTGTVLALGVSNVDVLQLQDLYDHCALRRLMQIEFVENRNSPYIKDTEVRKFCQSRNIKYVGFGEFGSRGGGDCEEGKALPQNNLLPLQDRRVTSLAATKHLDASQMLLAWSNQRGVHTVTHSRNSAAVNLAAGQVTLDDGTLAQLDAIFQSGDELEASERSATAGVSLVYQALKDGMLWHILDTLLGDAAIKRLFQRVVADILERYPTPPGASKKLSPPSEAPLRIFGYNLLRLAARVQAQLALDGSAAMVNWIDVMRDTFHGIATKLGDDGAIAQLYRWTQGDHMETGGAALAVDKLRKTALPARRDSHTKSQLATGMTHRTRKGSRVSEELPDDFVATFAAQNVQIGDVFSSQYEHGVTWEVIGLDLAFDGGKGKILVEER